MNAAGLWQNMEIELKKYGQSIRKHIMHSTACIVKFKYKSGAHDKSAFYCNAE